MVRNRKLIQEGHRSYAGDCRVSRLGGMLCAALTGFLLVLTLLIPLPASAIKKSNLRLLRRVHTFAQTVDTTDFRRESYAYMRSTLRVDRRNAILMLVPGAYVISHGKDRQYLTEAYYKVVVNNHEDFTTEPLLKITTIPHRKQAMENFGKYLTPTIYSETMVGTTLLSPFHPNNFRFYKYRVDVIHGDIVELRFRGRRYNTQLVNGTASIDRLTGRILSCSFQCEYDLIHAWVSMTMGEKGMAAIFPKQCEALMRFRFLGNKVSAHCKADFGLDNVLDSIGSDDVSNPLLLSRVRPDTLDASEQAIYAKMVTARIEKEMQEAADTLHEKKKNWAKSILWDAIGDNVLNRIRTHFGQNNQGYIRINPVLNPLYMSYSQRRGFTYKFDLRASYQLSDNSELTGRFRGGYSFKQEQFYYRIPIFYYFDRRRNRYLKFEMGNGNRIGNHLISQDISQHIPQLSGGQVLNPDIFNDFKQGDARLVFNFDVNNRLGFQVGALYQLWRAVSPYAFHIFGWESRYSSFAPIFEVQYRPLGWTGPIFTLDYDHGIKGVLRANTEYARFECNAEYIHKLNRLQSLQMRLGGGLYTNKGRNAYFLNYENFQDNNLPGGWNDEWSGEFELLRGDTYNTSSYYLRGNLTYESPLLLLSWLPWVGHYMEMERLYVSVLEAERLHPYIELGYGCTTRYVSLGAFVSNGKGNRAFGFKFGFELFRHW